MKPLVTTVNAIRELATGLSDEDIMASSVLREVDTPAVSFLVAQDDTLDAQRIILVRDTNTREKYVPDSLKERRREALSRMASFAERARTIPITLPRAWHQYKKDNIIGFFALPAGDKSATRWIAEVLGGERADIVLWEITNSDNKASFTDYPTGRSIPISDFENAWTSAFSQATAKFAQAKKPAAPDTEMELSAIVPSSVKAHSFGEWLSTISDDQRAFVDAPTNRSIRLRGPAGSGKTLSIVMKAVAEAIRSREEGAPSRIVVVTHSWALAAQISQTIDLMGVGIRDEVDVYPLLEIAQDILPQQLRGAPGFSVIGDDSLSGKRAQLDEILEIVEEFVNGDWLTFRSRASEGLRSRLDSSEQDDLLAFAWDLLIEFGSVIGAAGIFPGAGATLRYHQIKRAKWMIPLESEADRSIIFYLYERFMENLESRSLETTDQVLADFLRYLETHAWNRTRKQSGYDLVFVDEFHLFTPLERQVLNYLARDVNQYPRLFMALDPRQSPSEAFIGVAADQTQSALPTTDEIPEAFTSLELTTVHRFTPQILELIKHVHHSYPSLDLGSDWDVDFTRVESAREDGAIPQLVSAATRYGEEVDIYGAVQELYSRGRIAVAVVDTRQWKRISELATLVAKSGKYNVSIVSGRTEIEGVGYRKRGLVVGPAEYLAGLQFNTVLVAGVPDLRASTTAPNERIRVLSLLYLALSRAQTEARVFVNDEDGGAAEVLRQAVSLGLMVGKRGSET